MQPDGLSLFMAAAIAAVLLALSAILIDHATDADLRRRRRRRLRRFRR